MEFFLKTDDFLVEKYGVVWSTSEGVTTKW